MYVSKIDEAIQFLQQRKKTLRCSELTEVLVSLGFRVRDCKKVGHKQVTHTKLPGFIGSSFSGGHGSDSQIKPGYPGKMIALLKTYRDELEKMTETPND
jgi:hypothetical protein